MALKQLILAKQMENKRNSLVELNSELDELIERKSELEEAISEAETEEEITLVSDSVDELEETLDTKTEEIEAIKAEIERLELELEELNNKEAEVKPATKGERNMQNNKVEERAFKNGINAYVKAKGELSQLDPETRASFTTVEGGALIPEQVFATEVDTQEIFDLTKYVNVVQVNTGSGKYPIVKHSKGVMVSVAELAKNPELAVPTFEDVTYSVDTYRGYIPVSQEVIDDAEYDVTGLIAREIDLQEKRTKNNQIIEAIKTMTPKAVADLDEIKTMLNVNISKNYSNVKAFVSSSFYNALDTMKDSDGRYLLQPNVTTGSGYTLFGKELVVIDDDVIGTTDGDMVGFFGDIKSAITLFDRKKNSVKWVDHDVYGEMLAGFTRFGIEVTDLDAGFYVTYTPDLAGA